MLSSNILTNLTQLIYPGLKDHMALYATSLKCQTFYFLCQTFISSHIHLYYVFCQNLILSSRFLNAFTESALTTSFGNLFQSFITFWLIKLAWTFGLDQYLANLYIFPLPMFSLIVKNISWSTFVMHLTNLKVSIKSPRFLRWTRVVRLFRVVFPRMFCTEIPRSF